VTGRVTAILFAGYTVLSVAGLVLLRANVAPAVAAIRGAGDGPQPVVLTATGMVCYVAGFGLWLAILARVPLTRAYPTAVGLTLVFTTVIAWTLLDEKIGVREIAGIVAVFVGVWLLTAG